MTGWPAAKTCNIRLFLSLLMYGHLWQDLLQFAKRPNKHKFNRRSCSIVQYLIYRHLLEANLPPKFSIPPSLTEALSKSAV